MADPQDLQLRSTADVSDRIVVKGIVNPERLPRVVVKGAADRARFVVSGAEDAKRMLVSGAASVTNAVERVRRDYGLDVASAYAKATRLDVVTTTERALQYVTANNVAKIADLQTATERVLRDVGTTGVLDAVTEARRSSDGIVDHAGATGRVRDQVSYAQMKARELTGFGAAQAAAMLSAQSSAVQYVREHQRALSESISALMSNAYAVEIERARSTIGVRDIAAQIDAITASLRYPRDFSVDSVVADMLLIFGRRATRKERAAAIERITLWFLQRRLQGHRLSVTLRRLDASLVQAAIFMVIGSDAFRKMTPREVKEKMPWLVYKNLGERQAPGSEKNCPIYKWKRREAEWSDEIALTESNTLDALVAVEDAAELQRLLQRVKLTRGEREIIDLLCFEGLTVRQAARRLRVTPNAVQMQRRRAAQKIERYLKAQRRRPPRR